MPVIGFAGGPFTLASYLVEGGPSRDHLRTKALMYTDRHLWASLMERLADMALASLRDQVAAGAAAVQVFDSWIGTLSPSDYRAHVLPASRRSSPAWRRWACPASISASARASSWG